MTTAFVGYVGSSVNVLTEVIGRLGGVIIIIFGLHFMGALRRFFTYVKKKPTLFLGILPATIGMLVLVGGIILWAFVVPILALPIFIGYLLLLALGGAFAHAEEFWMKAINNFEALLYSDTRRDMGGRGKGGLGGSFIMGIVFSAGWTPCIGPLLGTILTVAAQTGDVTQAVPMLTAYFLGLGIPFILTAVLMEGAQAILRFLQRYMGKIEFVSGSLLVIIGMMVASGNIQSLSANLATQQADLSFRIEECGLGFARGELTFNQAQDCIGGSLYPVALGQSASGELNAEDATHCAKLLLNFNSQCSSAATDIQNLLTMLKTSKRDRSVAKLAQPATEQKGIEEEFYQIVTPAEINNQPSGLFFRGLVGFSMMVM